MSHALIARNDDLRQLKESGHSLRVIDGFLVVEDIPYIDSDGSLREASLLMQLELSADQTVQPSDHVAYWTGSFPFTTAGKKLEVLGESRHRQSLRDGTMLTYMFSARPEAGRYRDYQHKVETYIEIIVREARRKYHAATARRWRVERADGNQSPFKYIETASARQNTTDIAAKLRNETVAIVGVGGTGSYILDYVVKTWVAEIHVYDDDRLLQHNAFRSPGAFGVDELEGAPSKATIHCERYRRMREGLFAHVARIGEHNIDVLRPYDTIFLCIDGDEIKDSILNLSEEEGSVCIDVGMGIYREGEKLGGIIRTTTSEPGQRAHIRANNRIDMAGADGGEYDRNIQIAELNALNAALAVIKWKKIRGIYQDIVREGDCGYVLDGNRIINRDYIGGVE